MLDSLSSLFSGALVSQDSHIVSVLLVIYGSNALLTGVKHALEKVKDKTASTLDNRAYGVVSTVSGALSAVIGWLTANSSRLPPLSRAEVEEEGKGSDASPL